MIYRILNTVPTYNKHIHNKHFFQNMHTLFAQTKLCLFWEEEDFGKIKKRLHFFNIESLKTQFLFFF